jgi:hypothetical protein
MFSIVSSLGLFAKRIRYYFVFTIRELKGGLPYTGVRSNLDSCLRLSSGFTGSIERLK